MNKTKKFGHDPKTCPDCIEANKRVMEMIKDINEHSHFKDPELRQNDWELSKDIDNEEGDDGHVTKYI